MKKFKLTGLFTLAALMAALAACPGASAEQDQAGQFKTYSLGDLVISAQRPGSQDAVISTLVTAEDIKATNSTTAAEALRFAPGVMVTTGRKGEPYVQIHGLGQEKVLVLIDGVPYYETNYGFLNLDQIPADIISRIEIIKGAPSVLYGANTQAGVINIITKTAGDKPFFTALAEAGEDGTYRVSLSHGMKTGIFNYWLNYTRRESGGWSMSDDFTPQVGTMTTGSGRRAQVTDSILEDGGVRNNSDYLTDSFWARAGVEPGPGSEYYLNFHMIRTERGFPPNIAEERVFPDRPAFSFLGRYGKYDDWGVDLSGRQKIGRKFTLKGKVFYHEHEDDYVSYPDLEYADQIAVSTFQDYFLGATLIGELELLPAHALFFSLHYKGDSHKEKDDGYLPFTEAFSYTHSYGLEYRYQPGLGLNVTAGVSYDLLDVTKAQTNETDRNTGDLVGQTDLDTPDIKSELNPMLGLSYNFADSTRLFASVAKKTRFPTLQQLFSSRSGNPDLQAENSTNYTLGLSHSFGQVFDIEAAGFYHNISEWIMRLDRDSNYENLGHILICGLEIAARAHVTDNLTFTLDYNYNQAADDSEGRVTDNVLGVPGHKAGLGVSWFNPDILTRLDIRGIYEGGVYYQLPTADDPDDETLMTRSRFLVSARISKEFLSHFEAYLAVNNIFDTDYESENNYPGPGRNCLLGVTARY